MEGSIIVPTWDLFIIIFGCLVIAYNFIIGREATIRLIIATYIAILSSDGLISLIHKYILSDKSLIDNIPTFAADSKEIIFAKIITFLVMIIILAIKGGFYSHDHGNGSILNFFYLISFGVMSTALILVSILAFLSGSTFIDTFVATKPASTDLSTIIYAQSKIAKILIEYSTLIYALPALALIVSIIGITDEE